MFTTQSIAGMIKHAPLIASCMTIWRFYTVNHKKTWQFIFDYNFG